MNDRFKPTFFIEWCLLSLEWIWESLSDLLSENTQTWEIFLIGILDKFTE